MTIGALTSETREDLVDGWRHALAWVGQPRAWSAAASAGWPAALATELYSVWYARYAPPSIPASSDAAHWPALVHQLRAAHAATTRLTGGWVVRAVGARGAVRVERMGEQLHLFPPDYVHLARPGMPVRASDIVSVTMRRDLVDPETGWWFTFGRGDVPRNAPMVRLYWNCPAEAAPDLVSAITKTVEGAAIPYSMKCPANPDGFARVDPFVLYLHRDDWGAIRAALREVHAALGSRLRIGVPRLALPLGRGVALAEDPANGLSFGESRSRAVANGALAAMAASLVNDAAALEVISHYLLVSGVAPACPHLRAGTPPELVPPW